MPILLEFELLHGLFSSWWSQKIRLRTRSLFNPHYYDFLGCCLALSLLSTQLHCFSLVLKLIPLNTFKESSKALLWFDLKWYFLNLGNSHRRLLSKVHGGLLVEWGHCGCKSRGTVQVLVPCGSSVRDSLILAALSYLLETHWSGECSWLTCAITKFFDTLCYITRRRILHLDVDYWLCFLFVF